MPKILERMINEDPTSPITVNIETSLKGGYSLKDHWENGEALEHIKSRINWNFIILQNQSNWASEKQALEDAREYVQKFAPLISEHGGVILIPETWPKQKNSGQYKAQPWLGNFGQMYRKNEKYSAEIAASVMGEVIRIAPYWVATLGITKESALYDKDGSHPSIEGTYLSALVYYKYFVGRAFENKSIAIKGIDPNEALVLQHVVKTLTPSYQTKK